ncbi:hypothetical protein HAX54_001136 [Datura stramonium]|uniref:Uncharacterized protein n=1 Tax=Datura stramonium TaxID=4076 RepID=A0ABS8RSW2_DATST|nr:hypothetical protein [Datura stramonium]
MAKFLASLFVLFVAIALSDKRSIVGVVEGFECKIDLGINVCTPVKSELFLHNQHLQPDDDLLGGQIYYLLPQLQVQPPPKSTKKKVKFANDQVVKKKVKFANDQVNEKAKFANDQVNEKAKFANDHVNEKVKFANDQVSEKVKFANDQVDQLLQAANNDQKKEVIRVKIVISKKELQELLSSNEGGLIKVDDMIIKSTTIVEESTIDVKGWKPVLDIIHELD